MKSTWLIPLGFISLVAIAPYFQHNNGERVSPMKKVKVRRAPYYQSLVKLAGFKCDTVEGYVESAWNGEVSIYCNKYYYSYTIKDVGGEILVKAD